MKENFSRIALVFQLFPLKWLEKPVVRGKLVAKFYCRPYSYYLAQQLCTFTVWENTKTFSCMEKNVPFHL